MPKKVKVSAQTIPELRDFLAGADVDMGCRPVAVREAGRYATTVVSENGEIDRLSAPRAGGVTVEVLEEIASPAARLRMLPSGNRFLRGQIPQGLGVKE